MISFDVAMSLYQAKFKDSPNVLHLDDGEMVKAAKAMNAAIKRGKPLTDEEFYKAIGVSPPPKDALI